MAKGESLQPGDSCLKEKAFGLEGFALVTSMFVAMLGQML